MIRNIVSRNSQRVNPQLAPRFRVCVKTACDALCIAQRKGTAYSVPNPITHKHLPRLLQWTERAVPFRWNEPLGVHPLCRRPPFTHTLSLAGIGPAAEYEPTNRSTPRDEYSHFIRSRATRTSRRRPRYLLPRRRLLPPVPHRKLPPGDPAVHDRNRPRVRADELKSTPAIVDHEEIVSREAPR